MTAPEQPPQLIATLNSYLEPDIVFVCVCVCWEVGVVVRGAMRGVKWDGEMRGSTATLAASQGGFYRAVFVRFVMQTEICICVSQG